MEGKHVAFLAKTEDYNEVIFADVFNRNLSFRRQVTANEIAIHPTKPHVALICKFECGFYPFINMKNVSANGKLQVYDVESHARVVTVTFNEQLVFWRFVDEVNIILVSDKSVYRWDYTAANSEPKKVFDRHVNLLSKKIVDAGMDKKQEYLYILGQSPKEDGDVHSQIQLFSIDRSATQLIEAYQMAFVSWTFGSNPKPSTLLVIGTKLPRTGNMGKVMRKLFLSLMSFFPSDECRRSKSWRTRNLPKESY